MDIDINRKNLYVLVYFYKEYQYSVLKLKDAVDPSQLAEFNFSNWNKKTSVQTKWDGDCYPANFLQFGENKKEMESYIDRLVGGDITTEEIPVMQDSENRERQRLRTHQEQENSTIEVQQSKRQKMAKIKEKKNKKELMQLEAIKQKMNEPTTPQCAKCSVLISELNMVKKKNKEYAKNIEDMSTDIIHAQEKYKNMKRKYKELKKRKVEVPPTDENSMKIGPSLSIDKQKLALCRISTYSKYTCDLLDVVFGRETLSNSVIKGIKGSEKKVLDPNYVSDIQGHVALKFNIDASLVRAVIRNKLNTASKAYKL